VERKTGLYVEPRLNFTLGEAVKRARLAEQLGYESVWVSQIADSEDGATLLAAYSSVTSRIGLGISVVPIQTRHPTSIVQMAATLDALSGGRFRLGLGTGSELTIEWMWGLKALPKVAAMREYMAIVRSGLREGSVNFVGKHFTARWKYTREVRPNVRLYIGAMGPKMRALAGEIGDGILLWLSTPRHIREHVLPQVEAGRKRAGMSMDGFEVQAPIFIGVTTNPNVGRAYIRRQLELYSRLEPYRSVLAEGGFANEIARGVVTESMIDELCGIGSEYEVREAIERYREAGCTLPMLAVIPDHEGAADFATTAQVAVS